MKKILPLSFVLVAALAAQAQVNHLRVEMLTGGEMSATLAQIGKIVLGENDVELYDHSGASIGSTPFAQFGKIVFYDDGLLAIDDGLASSLQVLYDATQERLVVRGINGQQTVRVYSTGGQLLQSATAINDEAVMAISSVVNGVYLLQAGAQVVKFIKE